MHDLKWLRDNPQAFDAAMAKRGMEPVADQILELDRQKRETETSLQEKQSLRNRLSKEIGQKKGPDGKPPQELIQQVAGLKDEIKEGEQALREFQEKLDHELSAYPNILFDEVPVGADENDNVEFKSHQANRADPAAKKAHEVLGPPLGMDFNTATNMAGARFTALKGQLARLERALGQFMLDLHTSQHGFVEWSVPFLVRSNAMYGSGQLPKFKEDLFQTTDDRWLIPTSEVPLVNTVADQILDPESLPRRLTALTPCFRSEAGSAGKDQHGMIRQHQFFKVELVTICTPEKSIEEHELMMHAAETVLQKLGLSYRIVTLCSGDTGFGAKKTYDIEVWLPGQQAYREISSVSNCGDFQARRMNARFRPEGSKETAFVHTLNGSGVAVGRCLIAVLENYQDEQGQISIPDALKPYMGGITQLEPETIKT